MWLWNTVLLGGGLIVLAVGGETLVAGATRLARALGISPLVVGLTVVAFGTSAPEAAVTIFASATGVPDLAVGNVVGSNIANILLILGLAALLTPLTVSAGLLRFDIPAMVLTSTLFLGCAAAAGTFSRPVGAAFLAGLVLYTLITFALARRGQLQVVETSDVAEAAVPARGWWQHPAGHVALIVVGIAGLVLGADLIVRGATGVARLLGVSDHIIGLTIVAVGTSLPELATTLVAARRRESDIALGNVIGSNIFNVLFVTGMAAVIMPLPVTPAVIGFDGPIMLLTCVLLYPLAHAGRRINRLHGVLLLGLYAGYIAWTALHAVPAAA